MSDQVVHVGTSASRSRNRAVDVLKGLTLLAMVLVNTRSSDAPSWLDHSGARGPANFADSVYPCFIFASGLTAKRRPAVSSLVKRVLLLGSYGIIYNLAPFIVIDRARLLTPAHWRIPSVLGRIGLASAVGSLESFLPLGIWSALLATTWIILHRFLSGPDFYAHLARSIDAKLDTAIFGAQHMHEPGVPFDPEGLFGSLLSAPLTLIGGIYFHALLRYARDRLQRRTPVLPTENSPLVASRSGPPDSKPWRSFAISLSGIIAAVLVGKGASTALTTVFGQPSSKQFWTPVFVVETAFYAIAAYSLAELILSLRLLVGPIPVLANIHQYICSRLEVAGMLSLEFFALHGASAAILKAATFGTDTSVWAALAKAWTYLGASNSTAGVFASACLAVGLAELMRLFQAYGIRFRV